MELDKISPVVSEEREVQRLTKATGTLQLRGQELVEEPGEGKNK